MIFQLKKKVQLSCNNSVTTSHKSCHLTDTQHTLVYNTEKFRPRCSLESEKSAMFQKHNDKNVFKVHTAFLESFIKTVK